MAYAKDTQVSPERSRAEIEQTLKRYGADAFSYGYEGDRAIVAFRCAGRMVRFEICTPPVEGFRFTRNRVRRDNGAMRVAQEKEVRRLWRALALMVKAKLEAVESGITSFEEEFLAHILLPNGSTVGQWAEPQLEDVYAAGSMPALLPASSPQLSRGDDA